MTTDLRHVYALNDAGKRQVITADSIQRHVDEGTTEDERRVLRRVHAGGRDLRDMLGNSMIFVRACRGDRKRVAHFRSEATGQTMSGRTVSVQGTPRPLSDVHLEAQQWLLAYIGRLRVRSYEACEASDTGHIRAVWQAPPGTVVALEEAQRYDGRAVRFDVVARSSDGHETVIEVKFAHKTDAAARPEGTLEVDAVCIVEGFATPGLVYVDNLMRMRGPCPQCYRARCVLRRWTPALIAWCRRAQQRLKERLDRQLERRQRTWHLEQEREREAAERHRRMQEEARRWKGALEIVRQCVRRRMRRRDTRKRARALALHLKGLMAAVQCKLTQFKPPPWAPDAERIENEIHRDLTRVSLGGMPFCSDTRDWLHVRPVVRAWINEHLECKAAAQHELECRREREREREREEKRRVQRSLEVVRRHVLRRVSAIRARKRAERRAKEAAAALAVLRNKPARVHMVPKKRGGVFATGGMKQSKLQF